ncbi:MAG: 5'/3'-nucleotidase SurE [Gammaproteobacteria bacterium]|nr:5'/3'-nucleotidase SurE [Gammaproteobacteria bacterium]
MQLKRLLPLITLIVFLISSPVLTAREYRVLVTNDDGINSPLLGPLVRELSRLPEVEVVVSAPEENQSGSSQSSIGRMLVVAPAAIEGASAAYSVRGKPADAVRFGIVELGKEKRFDLVISGINRGANVGEVSHLSGTVGAAMEAIYQGIPAIAVSQEVRDANTETSAKFVAQLANLYKDKGAPKDIVISINIPAGDLAGVAVRPMGDSYLKASAYHLQQEDNTQLSYELEFSRVAADNPRTDTYAYQQGYITITPLKFDWTAYEFLDQARDWNLKVAN